MECRLPSDDLTDILIKKKTPGVFLPLGVTRLMCMFACASITIIVSVKKKAATFCSRWGVGGVASILTIYLHVHPGPSCLF